MNHLIRNNEKGHPTYGAVYYLRDGEPVGAIFDELKAAGLPVVEINNGNEWEDGRKKRRAAAGRS